MRKLPSRSQRKRAIARINGAKSRGPLTVAGKARSSQNARQHGLLSSGVVFLPSDAHSVATLSRNLISQLQLASETECAFARMFALARCRVQQIWHLETALFRHPSLDPAHCLNAHHRQLALLHRYEVQCVNQMRRCGLALCQMRQARLAGQTVPPAVTTKPRPMTLCEKIIAQRAIADAKTGRTGIPAVQPGDALFVRTDVRFSHEYVTPMAEALFRMGLGADAKITDPKSVFAFRDHLTFLDRIMPEAHVKMGLKEQAASLLAAEVDAGRCPLDNWNFDVEQWIVRLNRLAEWCPEYELPPLTQADRRTLLDQLCLGAMSYREIKDRAVWPVVKSWLSAAQLDLLDRMAPERFELPGGRRAKITYAENAPPTLAARIQDLYGVDGDLRIAGGKVSLVIQVLAPNQRPVQVTTSLSNFWKESYPKLKVELSRKYPKHEWR